MTFSASAIHCWTCTTDVLTGEICKDPFDVTAISDKDKQLSYVECSYPPG